MKIAVDAEVGGARRAADQLANSMEGVADGVRAIDQAARQATTSLSQMETMARRLASVKDIVKREFGRDISDGDARRFSDNWDRMRNSRNVTARRLRDFQDEAGWYFGHAKTFKDPRAAESHRRRMLAAALEGTDDSHAHGLPPLPPGGGGGGGGSNVPNRGSEFRQGVNRATGAAWGFGRSMLALAGVTSVMGMASQGVDYATEEGTGIDALKRRLGDLGVDFAKLQDQARGAARGLGVTWVESSRLAQQLAREGGNFRSDALHGRGFQGMLRTGIGFSRSFGLDPAEGTQFFGTMRRTGVATDDAGMRRLAFNIADAIEKGGFISKADEVLQAVADFASQTARFTLSAPNALGFAGALAGLTSLNRPGLDPAGAASLLGAADAAMRKGGAYGEASLNLTYAALQGRHGRLDPFAAMALMQGGLFGSTESVFGKGAIVGDWARQRGIGTPGLNDTSNFELVRGLMRRQYGNSFTYLNALGNHFGLSMGQAAGLDMMEPAKLGASLGLMERAGIDPGKVSQTGYQTMAALAGAEGMGGVKGIYDRLLARTDLTEDQRGALTEAYQRGGGNVEATRQALAKVEATLDQEKDVATETRDAIVGMKDSLTRAGGPLLGVLNPIRVAVEALARKIAPEEFEAAQIDPRPAGEKSAAQLKREADVVGAPNLDAGVAQDQREYERLAKKGGEVDLDKIIKPNPELPSHYYRGQLIRRRVLEGYVAARKSGNGDAAKYMQRFMSRGWSRDDAAAITGGLWAESRFNHLAVGDGGRAFGIAQWHPARRALAKHQGFDLSTEEGQLDFVDWELKNSEKAAGGAIRRATTIRGKSEGFLAFERPKNWTQGLDHAAGGKDRLAGAMAFSQMPLPAGDPGSKAAAAGAPGKVQVDVTGKVDLMERGKRVASALLKPVGRPVPAGGFPARAGGY